jgi:uncharacterized protein YwqG
MPVSPVWAGAFGLRDGWGTKFPGRFFMGSDKVEELRKKLSGLKRKAWLPIVRKGDGALTASKFSGAPWLGPKEPWPLCSHCGQPMQLFLQLNLAALPGAVGNVFGEGLLQMFYCTNNQPCCEVECHGWEPFSVCHLLRLVRPAHEASRVQIPELAGRLWQGGEGYYPAKRITGWKEIVDYPHPWEAQEHAITVEDGDYDHWDDLGRGGQGDKLAGWPIWIQGVEYPSCRRCGRRMQMVFQINSECNLPYMFGDSGRGHITQCPEHKDELAFAWACS